MKTLLVARTTFEQTIANGGMELQLTRKDSGDYHVRLYYPAGMQGWPDVWPFGSDECSARQRFDAIKAKYSLS